MKSLFVFVLCFFAFNAYANGKTAGQQDVLYWGDVVLTKEDITCLRLSAYHESRNGSEDSQKAVIYVILNRVKASQWPNTICDVVWEKRYVSRLKRYIPQFSWTLDGKYDTPYNKQAWKKTEHIVRDVFRNTDDITGGATHYHASYVSPDWRNRLSYTKTIGKHLFYK